MNHLSSKRHSEFTLLFMFLAVIFGAYVRIFPVARAGFPLIDGGLFYSMTRDLVSAGFHLPIVTSYNHLNIPFAYPPLPIYLAGSLFALTKINLLEIVRWLPVIFSLLTIPAFFLLARELLESSVQAALATLVFALLPRSYDWTIAGGGVTRAPALLFLILMVLSTYLAFRRKSWKASIMSAIFGGLVLMSHPERSLQAAAAGLIFWLWLERTRKGTLRASLIGAGALLISSPWWVTALVRYGAGTLVMAAQVSGDRWLFWTPFLQLNFTDEALPIAGLLSILGAFICWKQRKGYLAIWLVAAFLVDLRGAPHIIAIQVSLLVAIALTEIILPAFAKFSSSWLEVLGTTLGRILFGYIIIVMLFNAQLNITNLVNLVPSTEDRQAIEWTTSMTPVEARFLVLDWQGTPTLSPLQEWFPVLSDRMDIVTLQGREWLPGLANFTARLATYPELHNCLYKEAACLETWAKENRESFDYLYLSLLSPSGAVQASSLSTSLLSSAQYHLVYEKPEVLIFERLP